MATKYVATTGSDSNGDGSIGNPWQTLNFATAHIGPTDTLFCRGGTYYESLNDVQIPNGLGDTQQTIISAYPGETVWVKPFNSPNNRYVMYFATTQSYITFDGLNQDASNGDGTNAMSCLNITSGTDSGFFYNAHHITYQNAEFIGNRSGTIPPNPGASLCIANPALDVDAVGFNKFLNLKMHGTGGANANYAFYISTSNNLLDGCEMYDVGYQAGQFYELVSSNPPSYNIIRKCLIHDITQGGDTRRAGISLAGANNLAYDNLIYNITSPTGFDGLQQGIQVFSGSGHMVYNNTIYNAGDAITIGPTNGVQIVNNIAWGAPPSAVNGIHDYGSTGTFQATNSWNVFPGIDPQFVSSGTGNFHLQSTSPAIGVGTTLSQVPDDLDGVYQGPPYDIGCYRYSTAPPSGGGGSGGPGQGGGSGGGGADPIETVHVAENVSTSGVPPAPPPDPTVINIRFVCGPITVDLGQYQWGYQDQLLYLEREFGTSSGGSDIGLIGYGTSSSFTPPDIGTLTTGFANFFREKFGITRSYFQISLIKTNDLLDQLRTLTIYAMKTGNFVRFYPNKANLQIYTDLDWELTTLFTQVIENRETVQLVLTQKL